MIAAWLPGPAGAIGLLPLSALGSGRKGRRTPCRGLTICEPLLSAAQGHALNRSRPPHVSEGFLKPQSAISSCQYRVPRSD